MITHYTDMKGKPCPFGGRIQCDYGYCPSCEICPYWLYKQKERARELAKEIDNLKEVK